MLDSWLSNTTERAHAFAIAVAGGRWWVFRVAALVLALSLLKAFPSYDLSYTQFKPFWDAVQLQVNDPFVNHPADPSTHNVDARLRLTYPVFAHLLGLNGTTAHLLAQLVFLYVLLLGTVIATHKITGDKATATLFAFGFALTIPGEILASDYRGIFDVVGYAALVWLCVAVRPWQVFALTILAAFSDERALAATGFIFVWNAWRQDGLERFALRRILRPGSATGAMLLAWAAYVVARTYLISALGLRPVFEVYPFYPPALANFVNQLNIGPLGLWTALGGFWCLAIAAFVILAMRSQFRFLGPELAGIAVFWYLAVSVVDVTRSLGYLVPLMFIALDVLVRYESAGTVRRLVLLSGLISLFPTYYVGGHDVASMWWPAPFQLIRMMIGGSARFLVGG